MRQWGKGFRFKQWQFLRLMAVVSRHLDAHVQNQGVWLTGPGQSCQDTASKDQTLSLDLQRHESALFEAKHPVISQIFQNESLHFIPLKTEVIVNMIHVLYSAFSSASPHHASVKNWKEWDHFCESPGWTQSQHCAQYLPRGVSPGVYYPRCGC